MIAQLSEYRKPWFWLGVHIILGLVSTISPLPLIIYFYVFLFSSLPSILSSKNSKTNLSLIVVYLVPFEILSRMAQTSPFIPYELSKYLMFFLLIYGIFKASNIGRIGYFLLFLLIPALFYDLSGEVNYQGLVFNVLAPINLCLGVIYFYKNPIATEHFEKLIIFIVLPLISALVFTYIKTPDFDTIEFTLGANFETTGGFGSNQVSTVFGLGMFLTFYLWFNRVSLSSYRLFDAGILFLFSFQGLLSFSRGGMIGGVFAIFIFLFFNKKKSSNTNRKKTSASFVIPALILVFVSVWLANEVTDGQLLLRYQGETAGTLSGSKEKDLNSVTSNRSSIFEGDWELFQENPFGVGAGASQYLRKTLNGVVAHTELSRLIAEHGYLGLVFFSVITILPLLYFKKSYSGELKNFMIALYFLAWYTSFHAATRNFVTPLLIGIAFMHIQPDKTRNEYKKIVA
jgi:hypothetical protein